MGEKLHMTQAIERLTELLMCREFTATISILQFILTVCMQLVKARPELPPGAFAAGR